MSADYPVSVERARKIRDGYMDGTTRSHLAAAFLAADEARRTAERERDEAVSRLGEDGTPAMLWKERAKAAEAKLSAVEAVLDRDKIANAIADCDEASDWGADYGQEAEAVLAIFRAALKGTDQ